MGPRLELEVVKVEEGLCDGRVLFHKYQQRSAEEARAQQAEWDEKAADLAGRFVKNFEKFTGNAEGKKLVAAGPHLK